MAPKTKFTKKEMLGAALSIVREKGFDSLTAKEIASSLGVSTRPVFTCFGTMEELREDTAGSARAVLDDYFHSAMRKELALFGVAMAYIRFAREETELFKLLFFRKGETLSVMEELRELTREAVRNMYNLSDEDEAFFFDDLWLMTHSYATLIASDCCPLSDGEIAHSLYLMALSLSKAIKEIPSFRGGGYDKDLLFREIIDSTKKERENIKEDNE